MLAVGDGEVVGRGGGEEVEGEETPVGGFEREGLVGGQDVKDVFAGRVAGRNGSAVGEQQRGEGVVAVGDGAHERGFAGLVGEVHDERGARVSAEEQLAEVQMAFAGDVMKSSASEEIGMRKKR